MLHVNLLVVRMILIYYVIVNKKNNDNINNKIINNYKNKQYMLLEMYIGIILNLTRTIIINTYTNTYLITNPQVYDNRNKIFFTRHYLWTSLSDSHSYWNSDLYALKSFKYLSVSLYFEKIYSKNQKIVIDLSPKLFFYIYYT